MIKFMSIKEHDDINSDDFAVVIFFNHCDFNCIDCQNSKLMHDPKMYNDFTEEVQNNIIKLYKEDKYGEYGNLVLSGGDPYSTTNRTETLKFLKKFKKELPNIKVWIYTGYTLDKVDSEYLNYVDYIKCGQYLKKLKTNDNYQYGIKLATSNQKIYKKGVDF